LRKLGSIFANPKLPTISDYYEPWTYDYENLTTAPLGDTMPVAPPRSLISGEPMKVEWSANWDDNLGGSPEIAVNDVVLAQVSETVKMQLEQTYMFYLPRICEHCLNPSCAASCPSGAIYKRVEDGIVLVDQDRCRGWRMCVTGCPYKKVYFNHRTGKAEKCTFCYPRVEVGLPTVCSETCVGRLRYIGLLLYDADAVQAAASLPDETQLYQAQLDLLLDPTDPTVIAGARESGISDDWLDAARRSPVYRLIKEYEVALPLHPEYRTMPMVWYIPPLSPVVDAVARDGHDGEDLGNLFGALESLRIPIEYLAGLFTAGDTELVSDVLRRLAAMRSYLRDINLGRDAQEHLPATVGMTGAEMYEMYRLLALAKYNDRYVIPTAYAAEGHRLEETVTDCALDYDGGPGMYSAGSGPFGEVSGTPTPVAVETFHALKVRQTSDGLGAVGPNPSRVNLLNWDGKGVPAGLFPSSASGSPPSPEGTPSPGAQPGSGSLPSGVASGTGEPKPGSGE
jgi:nitrate reductase beta subunit